MDRSPSDSSEELHFNTAVRNHLQRCCCWWGTRPFTRNRAWFRQHTRDGDVICQTVWGRFLISSVDSRMTGAISRRMVISLSCLIGIKLPPDLCHIIVFDLFAEVAIQDWGPKERHSCWPPQLKRHLPSWECRFPISADEKDGTVLAFVCNSLPEDDESTVRTESRVGSTTASLHAFNCCRILWQRRTAIRMLLAPSAEDDEDTAQPIPRQVLLTWMTHELDDGAPFLAWTHSAGIFTSQSLVAEGGEKNNLLEFALVSGHLTDSAGLGSLRKSLRWLVDNTLLHTHQPALRAMLTDESTMSIFDNETEVEAAFRAQHTCKQCGQDMHPSAPCCGDLCRKRCCPQLGNSEPAKKRRRGQLCWCNVRNQQKEEVLQLIPSFLRPASMVALDEYNGDTRDAMAMLVYIRARCIKEGYMRL